MKNNKNVKLIITIVLAVILSLIVIWVIISLAASKKIVDTIGGARNNVAETNAATVHTAASVYYMNYLITNEEKFPETTIYCDGTACGEGTPKSVTTKLLDYNGPIPTSGTIMIDSNGIITYKSSPNLVINGYACNYDKNELSWMCKND